MSRLGGLFIPIRAEIDRVLVRRQGEQIGREIDAGTTRRAGGGGGVRIPVAVQPAPGAARQTGRTIGREVGMEIDREASRPGGGGGRGPQFTVAPGGGGGRRGGPPGGRGSFGGAFGGAAGALGASAFLRGGLVAAPLAAAAAILGTQARGQSRMVDLQHRIQDTVRGFAFGTPRGTTDLARELDAMSRERTEAGIAIERAALEPFRRSPAGRARSRTLRGLGLGRLDRFIDARMDAFRGHPDRSEVLGPSGTVAQEADRLTLALDERRARRVQQHQADIGIEQLRRSLSQVAINLENTHQFESLHSRASVLPGSF